VSRRPTIGIVGGGFSGAAVAWHLARASAPANIVVFEPNGTLGAGLAYGPGDLAWRRVIGMDSPFFPVTTTGAQSLVLLFDTRTQAMLACQFASGKLVWRQPLNARAIGKPLVHEGQIYQSLEGNSLVRIQFNWGTDIGQAAVDVLQLVERAKQKFPSDPTLQPPVVFKFDPTTMPFSIILSSSATDGT